MNTLKTKDDCFTPLKGDNFFIDMPATAIDGEINGLKELKEKVKKLEKKKRGVRIRIKF